MGVARLAKPGWVTLELDVTDFDAGVLEPHLLKCHDSGITLCTMASLPAGADTLRSLYELNRDCSADIPERGAFYSFEEYLERRINVPSFDPSGVVLALDGDEWVGLSATSDWRSHGYVFNEMTGVQGRHRRRGLGKAMKVFGIGFARACGVTKIRTVHHPSNQAIIALNQRLGYVHADFVHPPG